MQFEKRIMRREAKKIVDSVLGNNRKFYWKVELLQRIISDDSMKQHTGTINGKYEYIANVMNSMGK